jgi:hypothetical protein
MTTQSITKPAAEPQAAVAVIGQAAPSAPSTRARALSRADWLRARFRGVGTRERWGYGVWLFVGLVFGVPESWAGITSPPWPALSDTVGHLEQLWHPVRVIVVALIVFIVFNAVSYLPGHTSEFPAGEGEPKRVRTPCGRVARCGTGTASAVSVFVYFPLALGVVAAGSIIAAIAGSDMFVLGYVIYGLIAIFLVIIPNALAFWFATEMPFPTLHRTVANLERRWRRAAMVVVAGLVVLTFHLVFFPWPDILFRA